MAFVVYLLFLGFGRFINFMMERLVIKGNSFGFNFYLEVGRVVRNAVCLRGTSITYFF